jgi:hypothetical protein
MKKKELKAILKVMAINSAATHKSLKWYKKQLKQCTEGYHAEKAKVTKLGELVDQMNGWAERDANRIQELEAQLANAQSRIAFFENRELAELDAAPEPTPEGPTMPPKGTILQLQLDYFIFQVGKRYYREGWDEGTWFEPTHIVIDTVWGINETGKEVFMYGTDPECWSEVAKPTAKPDQPTA